jgi:predicted porin
MKRLSHRAVVGALAALATSAALAQTQGERDVLREASARRDGIAMHRPGLDLALYGLLDLTFVHTSNANAAGDSLANFNTPWFSGSRWGIIGSRNLPDGAPSLIFKLEGEYVVATGNMDTPGTIFNRDAWVGFYSDGWGKLTFGRQNTLPRDFAGNWGDPYTSDGQVTYEERGWTNTNNFKQLINYAASPSGTRWDRGVVYKKQFGPFMVGAGHQFQSPGAGNDPVAGQDDQNTSNSLGGAWNGGQFNVSGFYNQSDVSSTAVTATKFKHKSYAIGGDAGIGPMVRIYGGWFHYTAEQPAAFGERKDNAWTLSGRFAPTQKYDFELGYAHFKAENAGAQASGGVVVMRNPYQNTSAITAVQTGTKGTFYASAFYHFDRSTEVYVVADKMKTKDGWADPRSFGKTDQTEYGVGIRTRF